MESLAKSLGIKPILSFFSIPPEELAHLLLDGANVDPEEWFDPREGLKTVGRLLEYFKTSQEIVPDQAKVVVELKEFEGILREIDNRGVRFHVCIDY